MSNLKPKKKKSGISYAKWAYIFIAPFFTVYFIFTMFPQLLTVYNSFFTNYMEGLTQVGPTFVGFDNYVKLFTADASGVIDIVRYFGNTIILWVLGAVPQFVIALLLAVFFTSTRLNIKFQSFFKTTIYLPNLIMASAFSMLFFALFAPNGPVNSYLINSGYIEAYIDFFTIKISVRLIIAFMNFVLWFGNTTILLMAGIMGIDEALFESANIDGANSVHVFFDITLPLLMPILVYTFITSMIGGFQMFDIPAIISNNKGGPDRTTMTVVMLLNNYLKGSRNYGMAGAVSVILFLVTGVFSLYVYNNMAKKYKD